MRITTRQDALLAAASLAGGLIMLSARGYATWSDDWDPGLGWRLLPLFVLCGAMLFRRTAPLVGLAIATPANFLDVAFGPSLATMLIYTDALYAASLYGPRRAAERLLGVTGTASLLLTAGVGIRFSSWSGAVVMGAVAGMTWMGPVLTAMVVREHRNAAELERQRAGQVARMAELDRRSAVSAERARMARELHDVVANHLSAVALHSSAVLRLPDLDADGIRRAMTVIRENSVQGLGEMRRMIGLLREAEGGAETAAAPRLADVRELIERAARPDLSIGLKVEGAGHELPAAAELAAYRIVQESLTNALKHAGPGRAEVRIAHLPDRVRITVDSPPGRPGTRVPGSGSGLIGMRERASILGGTFDAGPADGGWRVRAELPTGPDGENT